MKALRNVLLMVILALVSAEILLGAVDPYGVQATLDMVTIHRATLAHPRRGFVNAPGVYRFRAWSVTINENYERLVPDADPDGPTVVFLGDSVTFGRGVNDDETWINLLARTLHINAVNTGTDGYNSASILAVTHDYQPGQFVYLIIGNDNEINSYRPGNNGVPFYYTMLGAYLTFMCRSDSVTAVDNERFARDLDTLATMPTMTLVAFDTAFGRGLVARWPVRLIPEYTARLGYADPHPNYEGHEQIAAAMIAVMESTSSHNW